MIGDFKGIEISDDYTHKENEEIPYIYIYIGNDNQKFINNFYNYILSQGSRICTKAWSFIEFYNSLNNSLRTRYANKELICIVENDDDILFIESCLKYIDVFNLPLENIQLKINNQNYNNIKILKKLDNKYKLTFYYKNMLGTDNLNLFKTNTTCNLHEFLEMRETINYYKDLILSYNLSPIEKIMFAYDLVKSFPYHESDTNVNYSRMIYSIIKTGDIVCVGYSNFLAQILMELGFNSYAIGTKLHDLNGNSGGHERNVVYVEDDKYNIHGWYAFDATGDSSRIIPYRKKTETGSEVVNSSPISQYTYFLVPLSEYERYFIGENIPDLTDSTNKPFFASQPNFDNYGKSETISPDTIDQIIYNVRLAEGFKSDEAAYAVKEARHITNAIIKQLFADSIKYQEINSAKK